MQRPPWLAPALLVTALSVSCMWASAEPCDVTRKSYITEGVNRTNLMWEPNSSAILDDIAGAGITDVRLSFAPPYADTIRTIREAHERGLHVLLAVGLGQDAFRAKRVARRPAGSGLHSSHLMSTLDLDRFRSVFADFLRRLDGDGLPLAAIEIGNEINWADFNGDFPIRPKGMGRFYDSEGDLASDPKASGVLAGFRKYAAAVRITRELLAASVMQRHTTLLSGGLFTGAKAWTVASGGSALSHGYAMQIMRETGMLADVGAIGVHLYPTPDTGLDNVGGFMTQIRQVTGECRLGQPGARPCWLTEWGFQKDGDACTVKDQDRLALFRAFEQSMACLSGEISIAAAYLYDWDDSKQYSVHRCGRNLPSTDFFATD